MPTWQRVPFRGIDDSENPMTVQQMLRELLGYLEAASVGHRDGSSEFEQPMPIATLERFEAELMRAESSGDQRVISNGFSPRSALAGLVFHRSDLSVDRFERFDLICDEELQQMIKALEGLRRFRRITLEVI